MGVDFYPCSYCGETYCDCGEYVTCNEEAGGCGRDWCGNECAGYDGHKDCSCKLERDIEDGAYNYECEFANNYCCIDCENFTKASCNYCRGEEYEDGDLLEVAMKLLKCDRNYLIKIKNKKR
ncbi:MAG: hypothetical protein ACRCX8_06775 [Sarcina sp.]